ncbi:MAG: O-antigen ligase family protein [Polaromonas sp.]
MAAASVGLSMVLISLAKLLLVLCGLATVLFARHTMTTNQPLSGQKTPVVVLLALFAFALSLFWSVAPQAEALGALAKYGKLMVIILMLLLVRNRREALYALGAFVGAQAFLLMGSWLLFAHLPVPWATSDMATTHYAVFSSYLDQGIMGAVFAAVCWHLRFLFPGRFGPQAAIFLALMALLNVFFVLSGRSGHVVAIALLSITIMWELPRKHRALAVLLPFVLAVALFFSSAQVRERLVLAQTEVQAYSQGQSNTSSGIRLNFWHRAIQIMMERPLAGAGIGSWSGEYNRLQRAQNPAHVDINSNGNPHQEYLLWGVQLGLPGVLLLLMLMLAVLADTRVMTPHFARATQSTLLALATACFFNASLYDAQIGDFFCVLLGLLLAAGCHHPEKQAKAAPRSELAA